MIRPAQYALRPALAAGLAVAAAPAPAETDFTRLTPTERAIFHNEIREVLLTVPGILPDAPAPPINPYADAIATDLGRIAAQSETLFSAEEPGFGPPDATRTIALFTKEACPACTRAERDLRTLAEQHDLRVSLLDITENAALARRLEVDMAPTYILPDRMLRGHMPMIVLDHYLAE